MEYVFIVEHSYTHNGVTDVKGIGTYASEVEALAAIERSRQFPGFCDYLDGFNIKKCVIDLDYWHGEFPQIEELNKEREKDTGETYIFVLMHEDERAENPQMIGVYSSRKKAQAAVKKIYKRSEFFESIEGFETTPYVLGEFLRSEYILPEKWRRLSDQDLEDGNQYIYLVEYLSKNDQDNKQEYVCAGFFSTREQAEKCIQKEVSKYLTNYPTSDFYVYAYKLDANNFE